MKIDLHNHTNYSDGVMTPEELLIHAKERNVDIMALTDHDSVFGCEEIEELSKKYGVKIIKGMELSTYYDNKPIHIVCLFKNNIIPDEMIRFSKEKDESRRARAIKMMEKIRDIYNLKVDIEGLLNESRIITRANMLRNICRCNNLTKDEAAVYINNDSKAYIPSSKLSVEEGLSIANKAGCFTILAHPCLSPDYIINDIIGLGFDGIEVRYPSDKNDEEKLRKLAKEYNLCISAGSDCHGDETHAPIGTATLDYEEFLPIANALNLYN
ncbi:MAG: PHP domain-containing protein [Acholeplasmatales bacterium]|nr:PHP domain-containing protein [Acholeplasmatales bacterium]